MPRYKITVEYDGAGYAGWQRQPDVKSIQGCLETAIAKMEAGTPEVFGAGRTDAGVHASGQVAHFDLEKEFDNRTLLLALNFHLLEERISVLSVEQVSEEFNARFSAISRRYIYTILNRSAKPSLDFGHVWHVPQPLDVEAMNKAASYLVGSHDFTSFRSTFCQAKSPVRTLDILRVWRDGEYVRVEATARSFLHNQVRIMVGTLQQVGLKKITPEDVKTMLESKDRKSAGQTAPSEGLCLVEVGYE